MKGESLNQYLGKRVKIILNNTFWYKGKVINCSTTDLTFIDIKGNTVSVDPSFILMIEEVGE